MYNKRILGGNFCFLCNCNCFSFFLRVFLFPFPLFLLFSLHSSLRSIPVQIQPYSLFAMKMIWSQKVKSIFWLVKGLYYIEYQSFCSVILIGSPPKTSVPSRTRVLWGDGVGGPNSDDWTENLVLYFVYNLFTFWLVAVRVLPWLAWNSSVRFLRRRDWCCGGRGTV